MSSEARRRAKRCFALARSTTFGHERETAIARGEAIVRAAGLSLDEFDIPGRAKPQPTGDRLFTGNGIFPNNFRYASVSVDDLLAQMQWAADQFARGARQAEDVAAERARRQKAQHERLISECLNWLFARGVRVYPDRLEGGAVVYRCPEERGDDELYEGDLVRMARQRGWKG